MAEKFEVCFSVTLLITLIVTSSSSSELPKPNYARTILKVSRSLPGETEEVKVRTNEGNFATLIVKRREKSGPFGELEASKTVNKPTTNENDQLFSSSESEISEILNKTLVEGHDRDKYRKQEETQQVERIRSRLNDGESTNYSEYTKKINDETTFHVPPLRLRINNEDVDYKNWIPLSKDGKVLKVEDDTSEQYPNWKPVQADLGNKNYVPKFSNRYESLIFPRDFQNRAQRKLSFSEPFNNQRVYYTLLPHQPRPLMRTNIGANLMKNRDAKNVPPEVTIRSEINVKSLPKRSPMTLDADGTPIIHGKRVPDEPIDKIQVWRNARVINNKLVTDASNTIMLQPTNTAYSSDNSAERQRFERFFDDVNRRYGRNYDEDGRNVYFEWDPKNYRSESLKADVYETRNENYRSNVQKRMLHPENTVTYPNSQIYTPESQKISPLTLKPGVRTPVLQYAHPELGVQPAKIVKNEKRRPDNFPENQHSFTEQRQKKKYVLNDKTIVDSYSTKNYYPNQHFYGLKKPNDTPFWVKLSENLKNQLSTGVEKVSQLTRPVFDPLVEATHKISQNLGLSRRQEAQEKIGPVAAESSILIPALGLVASGAALGIGAVAVGRYLDVDVLKRSSGATDLEQKRSLEFYVPIESIMGNEPENTESLVKEIQSVSNGNNDVILVLKPEERKSESDKQMYKLVAEDSNSKTRRRRSLDVLDIFHAAKADMRNVVRNKRLDQRKGADSIDEIVEIDVPSHGNINIQEFLISTKKMQNNANGMMLLVENESTLAQPVEKFITKKLQDSSDKKKLEEMVIELTNESKLNLKSRKSQKRVVRSTPSDQELNDALQNLENAEIAEIAHIAGDWTNTPCAKRIFCDTMIQKSSDATVFMEKKMAALLELIQPSAATLVSSHFEEVMDAVRQHECSRFLCPQARPGNVFF